MALLIRMCLTVFLVAYTMAALVSCGGGGDSGGNAGPSVFAATMPGGFVQKAGSDIRPRWSTDQVQNVVPSGRGPFTFPSPYNTAAMRVTIPDDCGWNDCVSNVGYSYWRNMNNHVDSDHILIFLGLNRSRGGQGPTLFSYNKRTNEVTNQGPLFGGADPLSWASADSWYFSASLPTKLYLNTGSRMVRYDVATKESEVVFDVAAQFGADRDVWQMSSSNDDLVHAATLMVRSTGEYLGCLVYFEPSRQFKYYPKIGQLDECQIDKSGRFLVIFDQIDGLYGVDNVIVDLYTGAQQQLLDVAGVGAIGHHDLGYGYAVGGDGFNALPDAFITWDFLPSLIKGPVVYRSYNWQLLEVNHVSHTNARPGPREQQYACGSTADRASAQNEVLCFPLDGSLDQLVVAPVMTNLDASGGGADDYAKMPKGNLDVTGRYFIWTTNLGGGRLDAFIVKVPGQLLNR